MLTVLPLPMPTSTPDAFAVLEDSGKISLTSNATACEQMNTYSNVTSVALAGVGPAVAELCLPQ
jgi:hypothetical protein